MKTKLRIEMTIDGNGREIIQEMRAGVMPAAYYSDITVSVVARLHEAADLTSYDLWRLIRGRDINEFKEIDKRLELSCSVDSARYELKNRINLRGKNSIKHNGDEALFLYVDEDGLIQEHMAGMEVYDLDDFHGPSEKMFLLAVYGK